MKWYNKKTISLFDAILALDNRNEAKRFLRDLLTESEIMEFSNRWQAVNMLNNNVPYTKITKETGLSSTTVARISKWLAGGMGGYRLMLKKLNLHHSNPSRGKGLR